jgi:hypothetical protein
VFYRIEEEPDLFEKHRRQTVKEADADTFEWFILERLRTIFPVVLDKGVALTNTKGQTMYLLCFVSANPSPKVKPLATRIADWASKA